MALKNFVFLFFAFVSSWCAGQNQPDTGSVFDPAAKYNAKQLHSDFHILRKVLENVHPGLYAYTSKKEYDRIFDSINGALNHDMTAMEFRRTLLPIIRASHCEHTYTNVSKAYNTYLKKEALRFPMTIKIFDRKFYVDQNLSSNASIKRGDRILEINGESTEILIKNLLYSEGADGYNQTKLWWSLAHDFSDKYIDFEKDTAHFELLIQRMGSNKPERITIEGLTRDSMAFYKKMRYLKEWRRQPSLSLKMDREKCLAIMTIKSFNPGTIQRNGQDFTAFVNSSIALLDSLEIPNLVIDLRDNNGGRTQLGMELYSHLTGKLFTYVKTIRQKTMRHFAYSQYCEMDTDCFNDSAKFIRKSKDDYIMRENKLMGMGPSKINFSGKVYILINGGTMSAAAFFCDIMHSNKRAYFIGEEVGGSYTALNGNAVSLVLPATGVGVNVPTRRFENATELDYFHGHGVEPDYAIKPGLNDFLMGKDVGMDFVMDRISKLK